MGHNLSGSGAESRNSLAPAPTSVANIFFYIAVGGSEGPCPNLLRAFCSSFCACRGRRRSLQAGRCRGTTGDVPAAAGPAQPVKPALPGTVPVWAGPAAWLPAGAEPEPEPEPKPSPGRGERLSPAARVSAAPGSACRVLPAAGRAAALPGSRRVGDRERGGAHPEVPWGAGTRGVGGPRLPWVAARGAGGRRGWLVAAASISSTASAGLPEWQMVAAWGPAVRAIIHPSPWRWKGQQSDPLPFPGSGQRD